MNTKCKYPKLDGKITEVFGTRKAFAEALRINNNTVTRKMNGLAAWNVDEIKTSCQILNIPEGEIAVYFFGDECVEITS